MRLQRTYMLMPLLVLPLMACDPSLTFLAGEEMHESGSNVLTATSWNGSNANTATSQYITARTDGEWSALWRLAQTPEPGKLPSGKMAVGVFVGQRSTGGYSVDIVNTESIERLGQFDRVRVIFEEHHPQEGMMMTQALTSPWAIRVIDSYDTPPEFSQK